MNPKPTNAPVQNTLTPYEKKTQEIAAIFNDRAKAIADALPPGSKITPTWFTQFSLQAAKSDQLRECSALSIYEACLEAATLGLLVGGSLAHAYLVSYNCKVGANSWEKRAQFQLGYRGMVELLRRSDKIKRVEARVVYEGDDFDFGYGLVPTLTHKPRGCTDPAKITHAYAIAFFSDGSTQFDVLDKDEIADARKRSKSFSSEKGPAGPWVTDPGEMCKKTVVRRLCKLLPMSPDVQRAIEADDERTIDVRASSRMLPTTRPDAPAVTTEAPAESNGTIDVESAPTAPGEMSDDEKTMIGLRERIEAAETRAALAAIGAEIKVMQPVIRDAIKPAYAARYKELQS